MKRCSHTVTAVIPVVNGEPRETAGPVRRRSASLPAGFFYTAVYGPSELQQDFFEAIYLVFQVNVMEVDTKANQLGLVRVASPRHWIRESKIRSDEAGYPLSM